MVGVLKCSVLGSAFLARLVLATRSTVVLHEDAKGFVKGQDTICGGPEIWSLVTGDQTSTGVQNIRWSSIDAIASAYIDKQQLQITTASQALAALAPQMEAVRSTAHIQDASAEAIRNLITQSTEPLGGVERAGPTNCGSPRALTKTARGAFRESTAGFAERADAVFRDGVRLGSELFEQICDEMLQCQDDATCYCEQFCQQLRDASVAASNRNVGEHVGDLDELGRRQVELQEQLATSEAEKRDCEEAREQLKAFGDQIARLKEDARALFLRFEEAEENFYDMDEKFADLETSIEEQTLAAGSAQEALSGETESRFRKAVELFGAWVKQETRLKNQVRWAATALQATRSELTAAKTASAAMTELRELVSATLCQMQLYFDQVVGNPLRKLGIRRDLDLDGLFPRAAADSGQVREAVDTLAAYCGDSGAGRKAIQGVEGVNLAPLCAIGDPDAIKADIDGAVAEGVQKVKVRIAQLKGWLQPYRGQRVMTDEVAQELVDQGEPANLRKVMSNYGETDFYRQYLKEWSVRGSFLGLLRDLEQKAAGLQTALTVLQRKVDELRPHHEEAARARDAAADELGRATEAKDLAKAEHEKLLRVLAETTAEKDSVGQRLEDLQRLVEEARAKWEAAVKAIQEAHAAAVAQAQAQASFLEAWEPSAAVERLQAEAGEAERAYLLAVARVSEAEQREPRGRAQHPLGQHAAVSKHRARRS